MINGSIPTVTTKKLTLKYSDMGMKNEIYTIIRNDLVLRKKIATHLKVEAHTVYGHAVRKAPKLNEYPVVKIIMEHTFKKEHEIFDLETENTK